MTKSFEAACKKLKMNPAALPDLSMLPEKQQKSVLAYIKIITIIEARNGKWVPDWTDYNQNKYYPWFGFRVGRFVFDRVGYHYSDSGLGSRLCCKDRKTAEAMGRDFEDLYNDYLSA